MTAYLTNDVKHSRNDDGCNGTGTNDLEKLKVLVEKLTIISSSEDETDALKAILEFSKGLKQNE